MRTIYIAAIHDIPFLPYVYGLLRCAVAGDADLRQRYTFGEPIFLSEPLEELVGRLKDPDVVGFSCYVWNFRRHMMLARLIRDRFPECLLVAGGPHVPADTDAFRRTYPFMDAAIHGAGEPAFVDLLRHRAGLGPTEDGLLTLQRGGRTEQPATAGRGRTLGVVSPYLRGYLDDPIALCRQRGLRFYALWETNRGCPYSCNFCDWGSATMSKIRAVPDQQINDEIDYFGRQGVANLFICDANFGILPRDLEIARRLACARIEYGYPRQVRVNFAKESNDRVFEISRIFADCDLAMGTTLSVQSMNDDVLDAVERRNIGYDKFLTLSRRYRAAGIHTYSELILGLPKETRRSFEDGIGRLLDAGQHDDIRVFDFMVLPNSPVNTPTAVEKFGLKTVERQMYIGRPENENEIAEIVVETNTLTRVDWVQCQIFSQAVQVLHNGCYARYAAIHLKRGYAVAYVDFYRQIVAEALERPDSVLGSVLLPLRQQYEGAARDGSVPYAHMIASNPQMLARVSAFGTRKGWMPDQWAWLCIAAEYRRFVRELEEFVTRLVPCGDEIDDVLRYQADIVLQIDYDPAVGREFRYNHDLPEYFRGDGDLVERPIVVRFRDVAMGPNHQFPLEKGNLRRFAKAAVGESYPMVRVRHFQHQLSEAQIVHVDDDTRPPEERHAFYC